MTEFYGELIGTCILIVLGDGVVANISLNKSKGQGAGWVAVALGWGFAVTVAVYVSGFMSGAHLNPAVTVGLAMAGMFPWGSVASYIVAQMLGALAGALLVWVHYYSHWKETEDAATILGVFSTGPAIRKTVPNLIGEVIGTAILIIGVMAMGPNELTSGLGAIVVGIIITAIGFGLGGTTGYAINPARDLGPRIMHQILPIANKGDSDWSYSWIPIVGPLIGAVLGALLYNLVL